MKVLHPPLIAIAEQLAKKWNRRRSDLYGPAEELYVHGVELLDIEQILDDLCAASEGRDISIKNLLNHHGN